MATPAGYWIGYHVGLLVLLAVELGFARLSVGKQRRTALLATAMWVAVAVGFAWLIARWMGGVAAVQYLAGYAMEESLSIDNLFVFLLLFRAFGVGARQQPKVLFWGVAGAMVMRGAFIAAGLGLLARFEWIGYGFGALLVIAAARLVLPSRKEDEGAVPFWVSWLRKISPVSVRTDTFVVRENGRRMVTMLALALVAIETADVVFALDSIPAVLSITREPFVAYTSNILAVMGLRSMYFLLAEMLRSLRFLHYGLAGVLGFAGVKMLAAHWWTVGPVASLAVIGVLLGVTICSSLIWRLEDGQVHG
jgi:tellurite resistance protein TerC